MKKIRIFMVGGRRCGKTTVLTSLWHNADATLAGTNLSLGADNVLVSRLQDTYDLSESYFDDPDMEDFVRVSDDNASQEPASYPFTLTLAGKRTGIQAEFTDIPGEWFTCPDHYKEVKDYIRESHVIIFAIDTPCLMEDMDERGFGKRHISSNKANHITHFIKEQLTTDEIAERMILFVPIKCEKYYYQHMMPQVVDAVRSGYRELLEYIAEPALRSRCTAAILPILSLGGLKFFGFEGQSPSPTASQEYIYHANCGKEAKYLPRYCDQPLLYAIAYILKTSDGYRDGFLWKLRSLLFNDADGKELRAELQPLAEKINRRDEDGFVLLQNAIGL